MRRQARGAAPDERRVVGVRSLEERPGRGSGSVTLPNFIVIGAAKAGTTALHWYLAEHPQVFMTPVKETNYFAFGLDDEGRLLYGDPELHRFPIRSLEEYERSFDGAGGARRGRRGLPHLSGSSASRRPDRGRDPRRSHRVRHP
jgi:hypothetical protein